MLLPTQTRIWKDNGQKHSDHLLKSNGVLQRIWQSLYERSWRSSLSQFLDGHHQLDFYDNDDYATKICVVQSWCELTTNRSLSPQGLILKNIWQKFKMGSGIFGEFNAMKGLWWECGLWSALLFLFSQLVWPAIIINFIDDIFSGYSLFSWDGMVQSLWAWYWKEDQPYESMFPTENLIFYY